MAITLSGVGGLLSRLGKFSGGICQANQARGSDLDTRVTIFNAQFVTSQRDVLNTLYTNVASYKSQFTSWLSYLQSLATNTLTEQVTADQPTVAPTVPACTVELLRQIALVSGTFQRASSLGAVVSVGGSNVTDGQLIASATNPDGTPSNLLYPETINLVVTNDQFHSGTAFAETLSVLGAASVVNTDPSWPQGSGTATTMQYQNAATLNSLVQNGSFLSWSSNTPANYTIGTGTAGVSVFQNAIHLGTNTTYSMQWLGDGAELTSVTQLVSVQPQTVYAVGIWVSASATYTGGQVLVSLINSSGGAVVTDSAGAANTLTLAATTAATNPSWTFLGGFMRTPAAPPTAPAIRIKLGSAIQSGKSLYFAKLVMIPVTRLYPGGPYLAAFSGGTTAVNGDSYTVAVSNNVVVWGGGVPSNGSFIWNLDRLLGLRTQGLDVVSAVSTPSYGDNYIS